MNKERTKIKQDLTEQVITSQAHVHNSVYCTGMAVEGVLNLSTDLLTAHTSLFISIENGGTPSLMVQLNLPNIEDLKDFQGMINHVIEELLTNSQKK